MAIITGATATANPLVRQEETQELDVAFTTLRGDPVIIGGAQSAMPAMGVPGDAILTRGQIVGHVMALWEDVELEEGPWLVLNHVLHPEECVPNQVVDLPGEVYAQSLA